MFYLSDQLENAPGFVRISTAAQWQRWLNAAISDDLHATIRSRLCSNLKHIIVGLEMKAGLIEPHADREAGRSILFEPYYQIMIFEFCVGTFSVFEGVGSAIWLNQQGNDGSEAPDIRPNQWISSLVETVDQEGALEFEIQVRGVKSVRDRIHQDRIGARAEIDWHAFDYNRAYVPAKRALASLLALHGDLVPAETNLLTRPEIR